jgi:hypothetical protein
MCIVVAKYFNGMGWVIAKNRDQDYVSEITFKDKNDRKVGEIFTLYDHQTKYQEGMNYRGLTIITTSLTPSLLGESNDKDGEYIAKALHMTDPMEAAKFLIKKKMTGYIFCTTPEKLILVEAARDDNGKGEYHFTIRQVPKTEFVVRTNHGVDLPWAGFQEGVNDQQDIWAKSSRLRMLQAKHSTKKSKNVEEMLDGLIQKLTPDLQLNQFRVQSKPRQMRTIFQWAFEPSNAMVYIRPIETKFELNVDREMIQAKVLDNEPVKKIYGNKIKQFTPIRVHDDGVTVKTVKEELVSFKNFISR